MLSQTVRVYYEDRKETKALLTLASRFGSASTNDRGFSELGYEHDIHFDLTDEKITHSSPRLFIGQVWMGLESVTRTDLAKPQARTS
ncbi:hypothetical protein FJZ17_02620 [Candidatus Pacearchaeota archaeon]|nr:hypothetical protein [Candidatus Pacearchaeota archaeon]